jgi:replication factor C subunit 1
LVQTTLNREKLKVTATAVDQLAVGSNSDVRQMLNMLSTFKLTGSSMDFDTSKEL